MSGLPALGPALAVLLMLQASLRAGEPAGAAGGLLTGWAEAEPIGYHDAGTPEAALWVRTRLSWERRISDRILVKAGADLEADGRGDVARDRLFDDDGRQLHRAPFRFEELSITWTCPRFDLAAGRMILPWGRADVFNPTDNLTPFDTLDPLDRERLSSWAVRGRVYSGRTTIEGDLLPFPGVTRLPLLGERWLPFQDRARNPFPGGPAYLKLDWRDGRAEYPARTPGNAAWAIKVDYRGSSWEGSISHYDGWDDQPVLIGRPGPFNATSTAVPVSLDRIQPDLRSTGGDLAWVHGRFALRAEAADNLRGNPANDRFSFLAAEGEWTPGDWRILVGWSEIHGIAASATTASIFDQGALPALFVHVERSVPTGTGASIQLIDNLHGEGHLVRGEISWPFGRSWRATAGIDLIDGPDGTFLGAFRRNDRAFLKIRWSFAGGALSGGTAVSGRTSAPGDRGKR